MKMKKPRTGATAQGVKQKGDDKSLVSCRGQVVKPQCALWHYSKAGHHESIFCSGMLNLATAGVPTWERPAVWLSSNPMIEWTAYPKASLAELECTAYQPVRFRLDPSALVRGEVNVVTWKKHRQKGGVMPQHGAALESVAREAGANCKDWWCCYAPIRLECFSSVEIMDGGKWVLLGTNEGRA